MSIFYRMINAHVSDSNRQVLRAMYKKMDKKARTAPRYKEERKKVYKEVLESHKKAQELFKHYRF